MPPLPPPRSAPFFGVHTPYFTPAHRQLRAHSPLATCTPPLHTAPAHRPSTPPLHTALRSWLAALPPAALDAAGPGAALPGRLRFDCAGYEHLLRPLELKSLAEQQQQHQQQHAGGQAEGEAGARASGGRARSRGGGGGGRSGGGGGSEAGGGRRRSAAGGGGGGGGGGAAAAGSAAERHTWRAASCLGSLQLDLQVGRRVCDGTVARQVNKVP